MYPSDGGEIEAAASDRVNFSHDNPWRTVALILGAMLIAALVHPPLASASSTLIASITANVVTPAILVGSYPAVSYLVAGVNAWATNAVGVAATLVSSAASAGAGYAAASARARVEMDALRTEIAHIKRDVAASFGAGPGVQSAVVDAGAGAGVGTTASASTVEDATVNAAAATASVTEDPPTVDAERRARVEAELADLRRQLARLRAVWTPEADEDVDDAGAENADGTDVGGGSSPAVAVDVTGDVDWGAVAKSRALWSPGADDSSGAETSSSSPAAPGAPRVRLTVRSSSARRRWTGTPPRVSPRSSPRSSWSSRASGRRRRRIIRRFPRVKPTPTRRVGRRRGGGGTRGRGFGARVGFRRLGGAGEVARRVVPFG